jgi:hypothetical protein
MSADSLILYVRCQTGPASCFFAIAFPLLGKREKTASKGCQDSMSSEASQIMESTQFVIEQ